MVTPRFVTQERVTFLAEQVETFIDDLISNGEMISVVIIVMGQKANGDHVGETRATHNVTPEGYRTMLHHSLDNPLERFTE